MILGYRCFRAIILVVTAVSASFWMACSKAEPAPQADDANQATQQMIRLLEKIASQGDFQSDGFLNDRYVAYLEGLEPQSSVKGQAHQAFNLGRQYLFSGRTQDALVQLQKIQTLTETHPTLFDAETSRAFLSMLALAYLRLGEEENCVAGHDAEACIFPIKGGGLHQLPQGSQKAFDIYLRLLESNPQDLNARWLLNIAAMTLDRYPQGVPESWRIDPQWFASPIEFPLFPNLAAETGTDVMGLAGSVVVEDFNGDGFLDLLTSSWGIKDDLVYLESDGNGGYVNRTQAAGLTGMKGGLNMIQADVNNDGWMDVLVLRGAWRRHGGHHPNSLLLNEKGHFVDGTQAAGLLAFSPTQTAAWADFDRDGWIDLFVGNESSPGDIHPCKLYRNTGCGMFADITAASGLHLVGYVKAVAAGDFDNDGDVDLYLSKLNDANQLLRNDGLSSDGQSMAFTDVTDAAGVGEPIQSFPAWFFDYDNDGWLDLFVSGYGREYVDTASGAVLADYLGMADAAELPRMYRNQGDGRFEDVTQALSLNHVYLTMGSGYGDLDNDGWLDFYLGTGAPDFQALVPNIMLRNNQGKSFQNVTTPGGFGHLQKGHGIAFSDLDQDGDQDVYAVMGGAYTGDTFPNALFANPGFGAPWLSLELEGRQSTRDARGARVKLGLTTPSGHRELHRVIASGGSFGAASLRCHLGLGDATGIERLEITWPVSGTQVYAISAMNRAYRLVEGEGAAVPLNRPTFTFRTQKPTHHH